MNSVVVTLIVIAGVGLLAALGMGAFFALKPKFMKRPVSEISTGRLSAGSGGLNSEEALSRSSSDEPQYSLPGSINPNKFDKDSTGSPVVTSFENSDTYRRLLQQLMKTYQTADTQQLPTQPAIVRAQAVEVVPEVRQQLDSIVPTTPAASTTVEQQTTTTTKIISTTTTNPTSAAAAVRPQQVANDIAVPTSQSQSQSSVVVSAPLQFTGLLSQIEAHASKELKEYGKIVGMAFHANKLYVPSFSNGRIGVLGTPDLTPVREITSCLRCTIYDMAIMPAQTASGKDEIVVSLGKQKRLKKFSLDTAKLVKDLTLDFAPKGIAINQYGEVFVLGWSDSTVYVFDPELTFIGTIQVPVRGLRQDCNYIAVNDTDAIFVSCELGIYIFDLKGRLLKVLHPLQATFSYSVGIALDERGNIFAVRRGTGIVDVYDRDGNYVQSVGESNAENSLWSDVTARNGELYVVDYLTSTIKQFRYKASRA